METSSIFNSIQELHELEEKAAKGKEIEDTDTFLVRTALKAEGWKQLLCEEAISRGYKRFRGEEVGEPSWFAVDDEVPEASEISGLEVTEEEQTKPGRVFNLLGDMGGEEPKEQEEVREEGPEISEHVRYLNGINIMRTDNPEWEDFLWTYMKLHKLKPSDMYGLVGPRPWKDDPLWSNIEDEEIGEPGCSGVHTGRESVLSALEDETREQYNKRMFDEYFRDIKKEEAMEIENVEVEDKQKYDLEVAKKRMQETLDFKPSPIDALKEKARKHLADTRKRVVVGDDVGWLCEECNSVWSLEQQICPNRCRKAEPPTVEHRGWPKEEGSGLVADIRFPEEEAADPLAADPDWLTEHMAKHLEIEDKSLEEKKEAMAERMKKILGVEKLPGEPEPCPLCDAMDGELCGCCHTCEEQMCKCCEHCKDFPCICDITEECPICEGRIAIGEACPGGCDADMIELVKLYDEVKKSTDLGFEDKVRYLSLLKEKMKQYEGEDDVEFQSAPMEEREDH